MRVRARRVGLTSPGNSACFAPNLLAQDFKAAPVNHKWVADTTYVPTREGWLYLVSVMDLCNRQRLHSGLDYACPAQHTA